MPKVSPFWSAALGVRMNLWKHIFFGADLVCSPKSPGAKKQAISYQLSALMGEG